MIQHHNQSKYDLPFDTILSAILLSSTPVVPFTQLLEHVNGVQIYEWFLHSVILGKHVDLMHKMLQLHFQGRSRELAPFFTRSNPVKRIEQLVMTYCPDEKMRTLFFALIGALKSSQ
jgi:hypothetical protein